MMSLVIPFRYGTSDSIELRYALRSFDLNVPDIHDAFLIGDDNPLWYFGSRIPYKQDNRPGVCQVLAKLKVACESDLITDKFIFSNDDVYMLGDLPKHDIYMKSSPLRQGGIHHQGYQLTMDELDRRKVVHPYRDHELHAPCIYDKAKALELLNAIDIKLPYSFRTLYWNIHAYNPQPVNDTKVFKFAPPRPNAWFHSSNDSTCSDAPFVAWLKKTFPHKSRWEA